MKSWSFTVPGTGDVFQMEMKTNLDLHQAEMMPPILPCIPRVGDCVTSSFSHPNSPHYRLTLQVVTVDFSAGKVEVELHLPQWSIPYEGGKKSLKAWYKQIYEKVTGQWFV